MKKIEDYIDTKVAIHCNSKEEAIKINILIVNSGGRDLFNLNPGLFEDYKENTCFQLSSIKSKHNCFGSLNFYSKEEKYTIYPASDFLEEEIPEYVECVSPLPGVNVGTIYKTDVEGKVHVEEYTYFTSECRNQPTHQFQPSTEEAYDLQNKPKFEVGKWYKNLNSNYIAKAIEGSYIKNNRFFHGEYITDNKKFYNSDNKSSLGWQNNTVECTLEEIQEFLPDGHPDKIIKNTDLEIKDLILGNYYVSINNYIFKLNDLKNDKNPTLDIKSFNKGGSTLGYGLRGPFKLATLEQIEHLNQCIEADKYVEYNKQMEINEFKKDDYIVTLKSCLSHNINNCFKQRSSCSYLKAYFDNKNQNDNGDSSISFNKQETWRYATKEEIAEYDRLGKPFDVTILNKKPTDFIKGNWYNCSCNTNLYRFHRLNGKYFEHDGVINLKDKNYGGYSSGLSETLHTTSLAEYFDPNKLADMKVVNKYLLKNKMTKEQILEKAKRDYPVGTVFKSALKNNYNPYQGTVEKVPYLSLEQGRLVVWNGNHIGFLYDDGNWAEIISLPSLVGRYLKWIRSGGTGYNNVKPNNFYKITNQSDKYYTIETYGLLSNPINTDFWELMPINFKPEIKSEVKSNDFVLPKNWCVKITKENRDVLNNWRINIAKYRTYPLDSNWIYIEHSGQGLEKTVGNTEITFEQFKTHVLKENDRPGISGSTTIIHWSNYDPKYIIGIDPITEKSPLIKPINKIELRTKKVTSQPIKKEKKQLVIIKTKQLKLN